MNVNTGSNTAYHAFDADLNFKVNTYLPLGLPFVSLTNNSDPVHWETFPANRHLCSSKGDDRTHPPTAAPEGFGNIGVPNGDGAQANGSLNYPDSLRLAYLAGALDTKASSPFTPQGMSTPAVSGSASAFLTSGSDNNANSTGSECDSTAAVHSAEWKLSGSHGSHSAIEGGRAKGSPKKLACLPQDNFNVLTPDKHVMLSIPAKFILPTSGSRNYLKRSQGASCTADIMDASAHGNACLDFSRAETATTHASSVGPPKGKSMFFSFCLCKSFSTVGGHCHHGSECDFIHCMPEKLPQVVSTDSGAVIDEILGKKDCCRGNGRSALPPSMVGTQDAISTFQVHWSTPIASLQEAPYSRLLAGSVIYIKRDGSRANLQAIPSELIYKTVGGVKAIRESDGTSRSPLRVCKHFEREKCARGPLCHFIHPVVIAAEGGGGGGQPTRFGVCAQRPQDQQRQAQGLFQRTLQEAQQQRLAEYRDPLSHSGCAGWDGDRDGVRAAAALAQQAAFVGNGINGGVCRPPSTAAPQQSWTPPDQASDQQQVLATAQRLLALLTHLSAAANQNAAGNGLQQPVGPATVNAAMYVVQGLDGTLRVVPGHNGAF